MTTDSTSATNAASPLGSASSEGLGVLLAYEMDDMPTIYAATSAVHAANLYAEETGELPDDGYPRELSAAELDAPQAETDEDERPTGEMTSIRAWLAAAGEGFLCGRAD
jgi:hypothetical protein